MKQINPTDLPTPLQEQAFLEAEEVGKIEKLVASGVKVKFTESLAIIETPGAISSYTVYSGPFAKRLKGMFKEDAMGDEDPWKHMNGHVQRKDYKDIARHLREEPKNQAFVASILTGITDSIRGWGGRPPDMAKKLISILKDNKVKIDWGHELYNHGLWESAVSILAIKHNKHEALDALMEYGFNPDEEDESGFPLALLCVIWNKDKCLEVLKKYKVDMLKKSPGGDSAESALQER